MISNRRMQLLALVVIANSVGALALMASSPAHASTCGPLQICSGAPCQVLPQAVLNAVCSDAAPGCTLSQALCTMSNICEPNNNYGLFCSYT